MTSPSGGRPEDFLNGVNPNSQSAVHRFPQDTPPYYFSLAINDYNRSSWREVGKLNERARVILPLPIQMIDNHNVKYAAEEIGIAGAIGFDAVNASQNSQNMMENLAAGLGKAAGNAVLNSLGKAGGQLGKGINGVLAASGISVNDFMTIMLKGPDYKRRDFQWKFSPKSADETYALRRIIQLLNNSMAPSLAGLGSAFFAWPKIFQPEFVYNGIEKLLSLNTFRMKPSVLTDFSVNYTPNGNFSPFASTKAPTSVEVRMSFWELEFWLAGNFNDESVNDEGHSSTGWVDKIINAGKNDTSAPRSDGIPPDTTGGTR
jgi:hypothetical protein